MTSWIANCQICNDGLCIRMEELKKEGHSARSAAEIMQKEAYESYPELKKEFAAERIRRRYIYHWKEKAKMGVVQIVPQWPMCKICGTHPVDQNPYHSVGKPADHGLCWHCHRKERNEEKPECNGCGGPIFRTVYKHGLCERCRKRELHEEQRADDQTRLDEREKEFNQTPIDTETEDFWTDLIEKFETITGEIQVNEQIPCGKVGDETLESIQDFRSQLFSLVNHLDEIVEQSEVSVRIQ